MARAPIGGSALLISGMAVPAFAQSNATEAVFEPPTMESGPLSPLLDLLIMGGPVAMVLTALSVIAVTIALAKLWQFHIARIEDLSRVREAVRLQRAGRHSAALSAAGKSRNPAGRAVTLALRGLAGGARLETVREEVERFCGDALEGLRSHLRALEVIAALAPLLGLLGTVLGMIEAFKRMQAAGSRVDPAVLSGGIWEALLTTAIGLSVAIPVVMVHAWLERRVDRLAHGMENLVTGVFTEDLEAEPGTLRGTERWHAEFAPVAEERRSA